MFATPGKAIFQVCQSSSQDQENRWMSPSFRGVTGASLLKTYHRIGIGFVCSSRRTARRACSIFLRFMFHAIKYKFGHETDYGPAAGIALSAPFFAAIAPAHILVFFMLPMAAVLMLRPPRQIFLSANILLLILIILTYLTATFLHRGDFWYNNLKDCIWVAIIVATVLPIRDAGNDRIFFYFYISMTTLFTFVAYFGILKFILQINGIVFEDLIDTCGTAYPQGTNVCGDYNILAMTLAVAAIAATVLLFRSIARTPVSIALCVCIVILVVAGFFVGSRRFAFVVTTVPVLWILLTFRSAHVWRSISLGAATIVSIGLAYAALDYPYDAIPDDQVRTVREATQDVWAAFRNDEPGEEHRATNTLGGGHLSYSLAPRRTSPTDLAGTISTDVGGRFDRWGFAWTSIGDDGYLIGRGLSYQEDFSCRFVECKHLDYPHATLMSAWLAFGMVGLIGAFFFYAVPGVNALRNGVAGYANGTFPILLIVMPFSLISGDTVLSIWPATVAALLTDLTRRSLSAQSGRPSAVTLDLGRLLYLTSAASSRQNE